MKIRCTTTFKEGTDTFHQGDERTVSDADGARFVENGWAVDVTGAAQAGAPAGGPVTLDTHSATMSQGASHG